jgi:hypothetical protein
MKPEIIIALVGIMCIFDIAMNVADYAIQGKHISSIFGFIACVYIIVSYMIIFKYIPNPFY